MRALVACAILIAGCRDVERPVVVPELRLALTERWSGGGRLILTDEHGGMIGTIAERGLMLVVAPGTGERFNLRFAIGAAHPAAAGAELELGERRHVLDSVDGGEQRRRVHAVKRLSWHTGCCGGSG